MKKVCIAIDYNVAAEKIAEIGYAHAKALNAEIMMVHVFSDSFLYGMEDGSAFGFSTFTDVDEVEMGNLMKEDMEKYLKASKRHLKDDGIQTQLLEGNAEVEILRFVKTWKADLLVIGKHKYNALESVFLGNTAMKIIRHATVPLLVISTR